jgi:hypothetical protein
MDRYPPREDGDAAQPVTDPLSSDASAWGQPDQPAAPQQAYTPEQAYAPQQAYTPDESQAAAVGGPDAATEYVAWSADASYQSVQDQPAETGATPSYAAPEPQLPTYSDPQYQYQQPADDAQQPAYDAQAYAQQQAYDAQAYAQQQQAYAQQQPAYAQPQQQQQQQPAYDAQAYAQQQQAYAQQQQQAYAQQQQQQPAYDPQAYAQQQQAYAQQQQAYQQQQQAYAQQQQAYGQQGYPQQPYYDQSAYGQQPSYYDQQAYAQQQQQWQGYQQPTQPYAYGQPGQPAWPAEVPYWDQTAGGYGRSFLAVVAGFVLLTWGLVFAVSGGLVMWLGSLDQIVSELTLSAETMDLVSEFNKQANAYGGVLLMLGIMQLIGAVGILAHRGWGRAFGVVLGLLGTLWGIGMVISSIRLNIGDVAIEGALVNDQPALAGSVIVLVCYLLIFLAMFMGKRHFRKKGVS